MTHAFPKMIPIGVCLLLMHLGCKQDYLKPADYIRHVKDADNGFIERRDTLNLFVEAFYQTPEYFSLIQLDPGKIEDALLSENITKNTTFYHFNVTIGSVSGNPIDEILKSTIINDEKKFEMKKQQMLYNMQNSFFLKTEKDSLPCAFYHAQLTGKIDNAYHFTLAFETDSVLQKQSNVLQLVYKDSIWLQKRFDFNFNKNKINQSPGLKI